jgi:hypothetical protein
MSVFMTSPHEKDSNSLMFIGGKRPPLLAQP